VHVLDYTYGYPPKILPAGMEKGFCFLRLSTAAYRDEGIV